MNAIPNQIFSLPVVPQIPGAPGSYLPPWLTQELPQDMVYPPPPVSWGPLYNGMQFIPPLMFIPAMPSPRLSDPNEMYRLPPVYGNQWIA